MLNVIKKLIVVLSLMVCGNSLVYGATFSQWASSNGISGSATEIYAINANITDLSGLANNYPNLTVLVLWGNPLNSIYSGDFDGLGNLTEMYLNENQISSLESGDFDGLDNLKYLYLNDNQISSIQSGDFDGLGNLDRLDLGGNQISSIDSGDFDGLGNLTELYLGDNSITSIDSGDFDGPTNLIGLYLDNNQIADIESSDFTGLGDLTCLSLSGNQLTNIDSGDFATLGNLTELYLGDNQLTGIGSGDFGGLGNLTHLYLNDNQLTGIDSGDFSGLGNLTELYLNDNLLTGIESGDFAALANLTKLYLSGNLLTSIESGDFDGLASLAELYLGGNQIETMDFSNSDLSLLKCFDIVANPLTSMQLVDATLSQTSFNALINGGQLWCFGIAEISGVVELDMSGVDFSGISDMSRMHTMDTLEDLLLLGATNITGSNVCELTEELDSLDLLDVIGPWNTFDSASQDTLNAWDDMPGNVLIFTTPESDPPTPNPATFAVAPAADSHTAISMTARAGSDASNPVKYFFTETSGNQGGSNSLWQTSTSYTDSGLDASTQYTYTVTMRDSLTNTGTASSGASATTDAAPDTSSPTIPTSMTCDGGDCNGTFIGDVEIECSGSIDAYGNAITYSIEAFMADTITVQDTTDVTKAGQGSASGDVWGDDSPSGSSGAMTSARYMGGMSPDVDSLMLESVSIYMGGSGTARVAVYQGGTLDSPVGATLVWDAGEVAIGASAQYYTITGGTAPLAKNTVTWIAWKSNDADYYYNSSWDSSSDFQSTRGRWNSTSEGSASTDAWDTSVPGGGSFNDYWYCHYLTYSVAGGSTDNSTSYTTYNDVSSDYNGTIASIEVEIEVDSFNPEASVQQATADPDLELEIYNGSGWVSVGAFGLDGTYTGTGFDGTNHIFTLSTTNAAILTAWQSSSNQDIRIRGVNIDYYDETTIDEINYINVQVTINGTNWTEIGTHTDGSSYLWDISGIPNQTGVDLKCRAIDLAGSNTYSGYYDPAVNLTISSEVSISGYIKNSADVPVGGVSVIADNGGGTDTTNASGYYEVLVPYGWSGNVTTAKEDYTFTPDDSAYSNVIVNQSVDIAAKLDADIDGNGSVEVEDLAILCGNWLTAGDLSTGDLDGSSFVDILDISEMSEYWQK